MASVTLSWPANPVTDNVIAYDVYGANGTSVAFGSCVLLGSVATPTFTETGLPNSQARTYYVKARNTLGPSNADGPFNITTAVKSIYVVGPGSAVDSDFAQFNGTTGALIKDGGISLDTDATLAANSNSRLPSQQAVKAYVDAKVAGLSWKQAVRAATTANGTLATAFANGQLIDGVTLVTGDRILIKNQTTGSENGIYVVAASGAPARATDANTGTLILQASCYVEEGTGQADTQWTCTTNAPITIGATALAFAQLSSGSGGITTNQTIQPVTTIFDGAGSVIAAGTIEYVYCPYAGNLTSSIMFGDVTGSAQLDVWVSPYSTFPPTVANTIVGAAPPTISSGLKSKDTTLTGWTVAVPGDCWIGVKVVSCSAFKKLRHVLVLQKT
jgi:hypothetical protein